MTGKTRFEPMDVEAKDERATALSAQILPAADVFDTLSAIPAKVATIILDPWYNRGVGGQREDYNEWLASVTELAAEKAAHVFV